MRSRCIAMYDERLQQPQVARDRELRRDGLEHALLDPEAARIDLVVAVDDLVGEVDVALDQRRDRARVVCETSAAMSTTSAWRSLSSLSELLAHSSLLSHARHLRCQYSPTHRSATCHACYIGPRRGSASRPSRSDR